MPKRWISFVMVLGSTYVQHIIRILKWVSDTIGKFMLFGSLHNFLRLVKIELLYHRCIFFESECLCNSICTFVRQILLRCDILACLSTRFNHKSLFFGEWQYFHAKEHYFQVCTLSTCKIVIFAYSWIIKICQIRRK